jgi:hypothetical protein
MIGGLRIGHPHQQQHHASRARVHAASTPDTISAAAITSSR